MEKRFTMPQEQMDVCPHGQEMDRCYDCGYGDDHFFDHQIRSNNERKELIERPFRYRIITMGELFLLWKHKELPLSWFPRDDEDTDAAGNTVMNFWFGDEVIHMGGIAIVRAHKRSLSPIPSPKIFEHAEQGEMRWSVTDTVRTARKRVTEYYNTRVIPEGELEVALVRDRALTATILRLVPILDRYNDYRLLQELLRRNDDVQWELEHRYSVSDWDIPIERCQNTAMVRFYAQHHELLSLFRPRLTIASPIGEMVGAFREFSRDMDYLDRILPRELEEAEFGTSPRTVHGTESDRYVSQLVPFFDWIRRLPCVDLGSIQQLRSLDHGPIEQLDWEKDTIHPSNVL